MNILIFSWRGPNHPNAGGAEISTHEHAKGWVKAGHNVTLFTSYYQGAKETEQIDGVTIIQRGRQLLGVQWEAFKWYNFDSHLKFDLVVDQFHGIPFFTPLYVKVRKLGFIHEVTKEVWRLNQFPIPFNFFVGAIGKIIEPSIFRLYKNVQFMTVSDSTKEDLVMWGIPKGRITVVHNGNNHPNIGKLPTKEKKKTAIYLGAISKDKGIEDGLKIFSYIDQKEDNWQFWIVGKSKQRYLQVLKRLSRDFGINEKLKFWGYVSEKEKYELLARAHVLVNPSIREGWGLVVIEAADMGTPTVGYNVPGLRNSIKDGKTGILCNPNPVDCSDAIISLLSDKNRYKGLRKNCFKWSKEFSWEKSSKESLELIGRLMNV